MHKQAPLFTLPKNALALRLFRPRPESGNGECGERRPHSLLHTFRVCSTPPPRMQPAPLHCQRAAHVSRRKCRHNPNHSPSSKSRESQFRKSPHTVRVTVQSTAAPSILDESGPLYPKNMPWSGQSGHIYEKFRQMPCYPAIAALKNCTRHPYLYVQNTLQRRRFSSQERTGASQSGASPLGARGPGPQPVALNYLISGTIFLGYLFRQRVQMC